MDSLIRFRVATSDKSLFEDAAKREGKTLSEWMRHHLLAATPSADEILSEKLQPAAIIKEALGPRTSITRPDPDKIAEFQRKAGMAGGKGRK